MKKRSITLTALMLAAIIGISGVPVLAAEEVPYDQQSVYEQKKEETKLTIEYVKEQNRRILTNLSHMDKKVITKLPGLENWGKAMTAKQLSTITAKAKSLTAGVKGDRKKAKIIHDWIASNIYYNADYYGNSKKRPSDDAYTTYHTRVGLCAGYAELNKTMLRAVGIPCVCVEGGASQDGLVNLQESDITHEQYYHGWNMAYIDGKWVFIDTTWDSRNVYQDGIKKAGKAVSTYFDPKIETYSKDHIGYSIQDKRVIIKNGVYYLIDEENPEEKIAWVIQYDGKAKNLVLPSKIAGHDVLLGSSVSFVGNKRLQSIVLPTSIDGIDQKEFLNCTNLESVTFQSNEVYIGSYAFSGCTKLKTVKAAGILGIREGAFKNCKALKSMQLKKGLKSVGKGAFTGCTNLKSLTFPSTITSIDERVFSGCTSLTKVTIEGQNVGINNKAFYHSTGLKTIVFTGASQKKVSSQFYIPAGTTIIVPAKALKAYQKSFQNCKNVKNGKVKIIPKK